MIKRIRGFIQRHFTWLSGTLVIGLFAVVSILVLLYVPSATRNTVVSLSLKIVAPFSTLITFIGAILGIHDWINKRSDVGGRRGRKSDTDAGSVRNGLSSPAQRFVQTNEDLMEEAMEKMDGWFDIHEDRGINLNPKKKLNPDQNAMLYVFATKVAHQAGKTDSPKVNKQEIMENVDMSEGEARVFLSKMGQFLDRHYDPEKPQYDVPNEEIRAELNVREVLEAIKYIQGERRAPN